MHEASFPPLSASPSPLPEHTPTPFARPLSIVSGSGAFYDFNLDFGCCFGHVVPGPSVPVGPDMASSDEVRVGVGVRVRFRVRFRFRVRVKVKVRVRGGKTTKLPHARRVGVAAASAL